MHTIHTLCIYTYTHLTHTHTHTHTLPIYPYIPIYTHIGMAATPSHWNCIDLIPHTPCTNYYLTGQDIGTLGLAGSLSSGYLTANVTEGYGKLSNIILQKEIATELGLKAIY